jgi:transketolase
MSLLNKNLRRRILEQGTEKNFGHFGSALSCLDAIQYLYDDVLKKEDRFILSKGHGFMALCAVLEQQGFNPNWNVHPYLDEENGVLATTGSLGHGLPIAIGRAIGKKLKNEPGNVYVMMGDGEMQEGSNWEGLELANTLGLNLNILVDWNKYQAVGPITGTTVGGGNSLVKKLEAFGYSTSVIDGHNEKELSRLRDLRKGLNAVILDTIKGKGIPLLEQNHAHVWYGHQDTELYKEILTSLSSE